MRGCPNSGENTKRCQVWDRPGLCKPANGQIVFWGFFWVPCSCMPGSYLREHTICVLSIQVLFQLKLTDSLCYLLATIMRRLYFLLYISTFFSSVPNRCIPDRRQLPSNAAPKHTTTYGDVIQIRQAYRGRKKTLWNQIFFSLPTVDLLQWHRQWNPHEQ